MQLLNSFFLLFFSLYILVALLFFSFFTPFFEGWGCVFRTWKAESHYSILQIWSLYIVVKSVTKDPYVEEEGTIHLWSFPRSPLFCGITCNYSEAWKWILFMLKQVCTRPLCGFWRRIIASLVKAIRNDFQLENTYRLFKLSVQYE